MRSRLNIRLKQIRARAISWLRNRNIELSHKIDNINTNKFIRQKPEDANNFIPFSAFLSYLVPIPLIFYAFTLGYVHNFSIPVSPSLEDSIYFGTQFIFGSIPTYPIQSYFDFLKWQRPHPIVILAIILFVFVFMCYLIRSSSLRLATQDTWGFLKKVLFAEILIIFYISFVYLNYEGLSLTPYGIFMMSDGVNLSAPAGTHVNLSRIIFGMLCALVFITPNFVDVIGRSMKSIFVHTVGFRILTLFLCALIAYHLTRTYSGDYMRLSTGRMDGSISEPKKMLWIDGEIFYVLNCANSLKIEGHKNGTVFFSKDIDGSRNRTACSAE